MYRIGQKAAFCGSIGHFRYLHINKAAAKKTVVLLKAAADNHSNTNMREFCHTQWRSIYGTAY